MVSLKCIAVTYVDFNAITAVYQLRQWMWRRLAGSPSCSGMPCPDRNLQPEHERLWRPHIVCGPMFQKQRGGRTQLFLLHHLPAISHHPVIWANMLWSVFVWASMPGHHQFSFEWAPESPAYWMVNKLKKCAHSTFDSPPPPAANELKVLSGGS